MKLPYWDPSEFVIMDSMHNLFLGLFKNHLLSILGIDITLQTEQPSPPMENEMSKACSIIQDKKLEMVHGHPASNTMQCSIAMGMRILRWLNPTSSLIRNYQNCAHSLLAVLWPSTVDLTSL